MAQSRVETPAAMGGGMVPANSATNPLPVPATSPTADNSVPDYTRGVGRFPVANPADLAAHAAAVNAFLNGPQAGPDYTRGVGRFPVAPTAPAPAVAGAAAAGAGLLSRFFGGGMQAQAAPAAAAPVAAAPAAGAPMSFADEQKTPGYQAYVKNGLQGSIGGMTAGTVMPVGTTPGTSVLGGSDTGQPMNMAQLKSLIGVYSAAQKQNSFDQLGALFDKAHQSDMAAVKAGNMTSNAALDAAIQRARVMNNSYGMVLPNAALAGYGAQ